MGAGGRLGNYSGTMVAPTLLAILYGTFIIAQLVDFVLAVVLQLAGEQANEPHSYGLSAATRRPYPLADEHNS